MSRFGDCHLNVQKTNQTRIDYLTKNLLGRHILLITKNSLLYHNNVKYQVIIYENINIIRILKHPKYIKSKTTITIIRC